MNYDNIKMFPEQRCETRFSLIKEGEKLLIVVGFNPSVADDKKIDKTMSFVLAIAENNGYDGFAMVNLYPLRSTKPDLLPVEADETLVNENFEHISDLLKKYPTADVLLAYGNLVDRRRYTKEIAKDLINLLKENSRNIFCLYKLKTGNPKHPLGTPYHTKLKLY